MKQLRELLADGLLLALPLGAAAFLLNKVIGLLSKALAPAEYLLPSGKWFGIAAVEVAAVVVLLLILLVLGLIARSAFGRRIAAAIENVVLSRIPGYLVLKSIASSITGAGDATDLKPALITFDDNSVLGFVVEQSVGSDTATVFVPGAPGAATGNVFVLPRTRIRMLDVSTQTAMRALKSRGLGMQELVSTRSAERKS
jgi:uncharacterized membrane protein